MTTILEALENAKYNLSNISRVGIAIIPLINSQLENSIILLEKGYPVHTEMDNLLERYPDLNNAPDYETT